MLHNQTHRKGILVCLLNALFITHGEVCSMRKQRHQTQDSALWRDLGAFIPSSRSSYTLQAVKANCAGYGSFRGKTSEQRCPY
ncbi:hypothetical protein GOODEAATRI_013794 [Goodea atripinnis]|uniref:Secreted protein n=1 Tax=Goodea atripinnis TaxID=208336 RepID=A0ABV0PND1_9TELE